jgi:hypothetical protein
VASIERRVRNGKVSYSVRYRSPDGRSRRKDFSRKVDAWVDPAAGRVRLGEWAERWYATTAALRPTTRRDYRKLLDLEILPTFAAAPIASIDALAVREWLATSPLAALGRSGPGRLGRCSARCSPQPSRMASSAATWPLVSSRQRSSVPKCVSWTPARSRRWPRRSTLGMGR